MNYSDLTEGMTVYVDDGFTCMKAGPKTVHKDEDGFYVMCNGADDDPTDDGKHSLEAQRNRDGTLIGVDSKPFS